MVDRDDIDIAGRGDENIGARCGILHRDDFIAFHRRLQGADRIDFRNHHAAAGIAQRGGRTFADIAETGDHRDLAGHHHVGSSPNAVDERFAAAIQIVELRLGDRIIDVDGRPQQPAFLRHRVEAVDAGRRLLRHALDGLGIAAVPAGIGFETLLDRREKHFLFLVAGAVEEIHIAALGAHAEMDEQGGIPAIVENHVRRAAVSPFENSVGKFPIIFEALALAREDRRAGGGDGGGGMVLRRIDVAGGPAHIGAERLQRLDQHGGLDRHMQRTGDAGAVQRLRRPIFGAGRHEARHFGFGNGDFLASPPRKADIGNGIIVEMLGHGDPELGPNDRSGLYSRPPRQLQ